jgi:hypothetical protein
LILAEPLATVMKLNRSSNTSIPRSILFIKEDPKQLGSQPSDRVIQQLRAGFNLTRQDKKRLRIFRIVASVLGVLAIAAGVSAVIAFRQRNLADAKLVKPIGNWAVRTGSLRNRLGTKPET